jgi:hypothetical protein
MPLKSVEIDFAVDSSGFGTSRFDRWFSFKYGKKIDSHIWIKAHLINGVKTHIITGIKITKKSDGDCPQFERLVKETAKTFEINEVMADKAYLSKYNLNLEMTWEAKLTYHLRLTRLGDQEVQARSCGTRCSIISCITTMSLTNTITRGLMWKAHFP